MGLDFTSTKCDNYFISKCHSIVHESQIVYNNMYKLSETEESLCSVGDLIYLTGSSSGVYIVTHLDPLQVCKYNPIQAVNSSGNKPIISRTMYIGQDEKEVIIKDGLFILVGSTDNWSTFEHIHNNFGLTQTESSNIYLFPIDELAEGCDGLYNSEDGFWISTLKIWCATEEILNDKTSSEQFKRRIFVGKVKYAAEHFKEKGVVKHIFEIAEEMPKASNNTAAFIVKHTEKKPATGQERTSSDIVWGLLSPSLLTIEHIKVRSKNIKHGGGKDVMANFLPECARDNNERSSMRLGEFVDLHPEFYGNNLQVFMDRAAKKINEERAGNFAKYPRSVIRTLYRESNGKIKARIPRIDIKNA